MDGISAAKQEYITTDLRLSDIAKKHGIKYGRLRYRARKENWDAERESAQNSETQRKERILCLSDKLLDKIERSIDEIDRCVIKTKERTKSVEYDDEFRKPVNESVTEKENIEIVDGMVDKMGLKQLVSTLKDIKDIHMSINGSSSGNADDEESGVIVLGRVDESTLEESEADGEES